MTRDQPTRSASAAATGTSSAPGRGRAPLGFYGWGAVTSYGVAAVAAFALAIGLSSGDEPAGAGLGGPAPGVPVETGTVSVPETPAGGGTDSGQQSPPSTSVEAAAENGDLGMGVPISSPACDGTWVVFLGAATDSATYEDDVTALLNSQPDARYTRTLGGCTSMRQQMPDGSLIYAVYLGPFTDQAAACSARAGIGGGAYVKRMDNTTPAEQLWEC